MNIIWAIIVILGLIVLLIKNPDMAFLTMLDGGEKCISLCIKLLGIYSVWLGILKMVEVTKLDKKLAKLFKPIIKFLFGQTDEYTSTQISINITGNILGMGSACTPSGINAITSMDKGGKYATTAMIMLLILNTSNLQIIPSTIIGLRVMAGSKSASDIILPVILSSLVGTTLGVIQVKLFSKIFNRKKKK